ncbi:acetyltransferase [Bacteroidia bacterium]|nr:acetyltransferase [Bacteroidia bacterium]
MSQILYYIVYYCMRYRRKVVRKNLVNSFPDKTVAEIVQIERAFYAFFCDFIPETIAFYFMTSKSIKKRITFSGVKEMEAAMGNDKSCVVYLGHYCNWEWVTSLPLHVHKNIACGQIYHPLENRFFDKLFLKMRGKFGAESITMNDTLRRIIGLKREGKQFMIGFISDQVPHGNALRHKLNFLHQNTSVFTGTERVARQTKSLVYYLDITRPQRGFYHCQFIPMTDSPQDLPELELTNMYFQLLEKTIHRYPQYWLWSHNRWKR